MQACPACRATVSDYRRAGTLLQSLTTRPVPRTLGRALVHHLAAVESRPAA